MNLEEFIEMMKSRLEDFENTYRANSEDCPDDWPKEYPSSADWEEQFDIMT